MRYEPAEYEWAAIKPMLPNKPRGVSRVNDRRVLNGIFWVLRSGAPWRDLPEAFGPYTTCYNRFEAAQFDVSAAEICDAMMKATNTAGTLISLRNWSTEIICHPQRQCAFANRAP